MSENEIVGGLALLIFGSFFAGYAAGWRDAIRVAARLDVLNCFEAELRKFAPTTPPPMPRKK